MRASSTSRQLWRADARGSRERAKKQNQQPTTNVYQPTAGHKADQRTDDHPSSKLCDISLLFLSFPSTAWLRDPRRHGCYRHGGGGPLDGHPYVYNSQPEALRSHPKQKLETWRAIRRVGSGGQSASTEGLDRVVGRVARGES